MSKRLPIELSVLRDIGWKEWDPIGLTVLEGGWQNSDAADEYDDYLMQVVGRIRNGEAPENIVDYLVWVETDRMGLTPKPTTRPRAEATVGAVSEYLGTIG